MISVNTKCIGCGACKYKCPISCISINRIDGQYIPVVDEGKCIHCNQCETVCVALHADRLDFHSSIAAFYGYAKNQTERIASSSGGIFFAIAKEFLKQGTVVGAAFDESFTVRHKIARNVEELSMIRGSKYVESDLQSVFDDVKKLLDTGERVLFSGVPCQIGAIKTFLEKQYDNLYTCEVFCHGAPRSGIFETYISCIEEKVGKITSFDFRSKHFGWNHPAYEIQGEKDVLLQQHKNNIYHLMFGNHVSLRDCCYECQFRKRERNADMSLGDFWGIGKYYPNVYTDDGVSAIIVNSLKGHYLIGIESIHLESCNLNEIYEKNRWMILNYDKPIEQKQFINDYNLMNKHDFIRKYRFKYEFIDRIKSIIRRVARCFKE